MSKAFSMTASWIFVLVMIVPGAMIMAEDPSTTGDQAVREAQPATTVPAPPALRQALASSLGEAVSIGAKAIPTPPTGSWGIVSEGDGGGGIFRDSDSEAEAWLGSAGVGITAYGTVAGGYFKDSDSSGQSYVGEGGYGIKSYGNTAGGYFDDTTGSGHAYVGHGDYGIMSYGNTAGGYFADLGGSGYSNVGEGGYGIRSYGNQAGGYFKDSDSSGYSNVGKDDYGIMSYGNTAGGYFADLDSSGWARIARADYGVDGRGNVTGGYFSDRDSSGYAYVGYGDHGIAGYGDRAGGYFQETDSSAHAYVAYSTYKIYGNGAVSFVQNHPYDRDSVIVYAAPEGDEVATYTRGTARLDDGEAQVPLGETFKWVTNPDIGLTVHLTPVGDPCVLYVVDQETDQITVRSESGIDCTFHYLVYGLRIGFEESSIVQEKERESYIPSMADHRKLYERRPELKNFNSLERFKGMRREAGEKDELDLSRANALRNAIIEFDPAVHELPGDREQPEAEELMSVAATDDSNATGVEQALAESDQSVGADAPGTQIGSTAIPMDAEGNVYATSFRPSSQDLASLVDVSETVEPGDVLTIDRTEPGMMRRAFEASDTGVIGVVAASAGVLLGMELPSRMPVERHADRPEGDPADHQPAAGGLALRAPVAFSGVVLCKVDAAYGSVWPGDLLVTSATPGHAMRAEAPLPGTVLGKALEALEEGTGTIRVLVMLR
jgi:hypothetical protein